MKRRRQLGTIVILGLVAVVTGLFALRPREPVHQGKRLSAWLEEFNRAGLYVGSTLSHSNSGQPILRPFFSCSDYDIPAFVTNLKSTNPIVRAATAEATIELRNTASNSSLVPALLLLLKDNDIQVREAAAQALKRIDPDEATKAGVK